jgi:hypothetical protein
VVDLSFVEEIIMPDSKDFEENVKRGMEAIRASPSYQKALKEYKESMGNSSPLEDLESKKGNATEPENTPAPDTTPEVSPETSDSRLFSSPILNQKVKDFFNGKIPGDGKL